MARNPNLVPTVITDVNGVTKTVHKKPERASETSILPAPVIASLSKQERVEHTLRLIENVAGPFYGRTEFTYWEALDQWYPADFLAKLDTYLTSDPAMAAGVASQVLASEYPHTINETVLFYPRMGLEDYEQVSVLVKATDQYDEFEGELDLSKADPLIQEQALAVMKATHIISQQSEQDYNSPDCMFELISRRHPKWDCIVIRDKALVGLLIERPEEAEIIATVVAKHNTTNPNEILGIMSGVIPALAEGAL